MRLSFMLTTDESSRPYALRDWPFVPRVGETCSLVLEGGGSELWGKVVDVVYTDPKNGPSPMYQATAVITLEPFDPDK